jgi:DNA-binding transcriptional LysR family regulator
VAGRLICPFKPTIYFDFAYWMLYRENRIKRPKAAMFRDWLVEEARIYWEEEGLPTN